MRRSRLLFLPSITILALWAASCSERSAETVRLAEKAKEQARAVQAAEFAPADWKSAEEIRANAQAMLDGNRHREAMALLLKAKTRYEKARDIASARREALRREVEALQKTADLRCKGVDARLQDPRVKLSAVQRKRLEDACNEIHGRIAAISAQLEEGELAEAKLSAQTTLRRVWEMEKQLAGYINQRVTS